MYEYVIVLLQISSLSSANYKKNLRSGHCISFIFPLGSIHWFHISAPSESCWSRAQQETFLELPPWGAIIVNAWGTVPHSDNCLLKPSSFALYSTLKMCIHTEFAFFFWCAVDGHRGLPMLHPKKEMEELLTAQNSGVETALGRV